MSERKLSPVARAYQRSQQPRQILNRVAQPMECTEDKCGIVWERWHLATADRPQIIMFATPSYYEVFRQMSNEKRIDEYMKELDDLGKTGPTIKVKTK